MDEVEAAAVGDDVTAVERHHNRQDAGDHILNEKKELKERNYNLRSIFTPISF